MTPYDLIKDATIQEIAETLYEYYQIGTIEECQEMKAKIIKDRWIPCSEKLPKHYCIDVEVTTDDNERFIGHYAGGCWYDSVNGDPICVKAWKEPSEPWEGEEK